MDATSVKSPPFALVVEDEPLLQMLAVEVVEQAGFVALEAEMGTKRLPCWNSARTFLCCLRTLICPEAWTD